MVFPGALAGNEHRKDREASQILPAVTYDSPWNSLSYFQLTQHTAKNILMNRELEMGIVSKRKTDAIS